MRKPTGTSAAIAAVCLKSRGDMGVHSSAILIWLLALLLVLPALAIEPVWRALKVRRGFFKPVALKCDSYWSMRQQVMEFFLVGGAVRDELLHRPVTERDWVVVNTTPEALVNLGFTPVGKDFPVFLHPDTKEEYALARTERKSAPGYKGFVVHAAPDVTLEMDLARRDFTINAMAKSQNGELIDPYGGQEDLKRRLLRHVSPAFNEDPVRILRAARFAARYAYLGFRVSDETLALMRQMVEQGEANHLVAERVWKEFERALEEPNPEVFLQTLHRCQALQVLMPELACASPHTDNHWPALESATQLTESKRVRFAALTFGVNASNLKTLCQRLRAPNDFLALALKTGTHYQAVNNALNLSAVELVSLLHATDAYRRDVAFAELLLAVQAIHSPPTISGLYHPARLLDAVRRATCHVSAAPLVAQGLRGPAIGEQLNEMRIHIAQTVIDQWPQPQSETPYDA